MKRIFVLFVLLLNVYAIHAQTYTFNMHQADNTKYRIEIDVQNKYLTATKGGRTFFSCSYYNHFIDNSQKRIGLSLQSGVNAVTSPSGSSYFIISRGNGIATRLTNGTELNVMCDNSSSQAATYDQLVKALNPPLPYTSNQTFTFDMRDYDNASIKFKATVDVATKRLKLTKAGQTLFYIPYYAHNIYKPKNRIGFALSSSSIADVTTEASSYFIIIRDNGNIIVKLPNGTEYLMTSNNPDSHAPTYDQLARALDNDNASNPPANPSTNGSNKTFTVNGISFTMVYVQGGTFTMGATSEQGSDASSDEKPTHRVTLSSYMIGQTEVTQALWQAVMGNNPSEYKGDSRRPVEQVSWDDCQTFLRKLNSLTGQRFRLPTEAEWEFAARGGNKTNHYKYSGSNTLGNVAWYYDNSGSTTHPVGTKTANELGIYDMSGNVYEWCSDWYGSYSSSSQTNPQGPSSGSYRVYRGGSWNDDARRCRVAIRYGGLPDGRSDYLGLRLSL